MYNTGQRDGLVNQLKRKSSSVVSGTVDDLLARLLVRFSRTSESLSGAGSSHYSCSVCQGLGRSQRFVAESLVGIIPDSLRMTGETAPMRLLCRVYRLILTALIT